MALIKCTECGKEFSDKAPACPNCGCPTDVIVGAIEEEEQVTPSMLETMMMAKAGKRCPKCHKMNISIENREVGTKGKEKTVIKEKSAAGKAAHSLGRGAMIAATGGLWGLTPKKSDVYTKGKSSTKIIYDKFAVCADCGHEWKL